MDTPWNAYMQVGIVQFMMYPEAMAGNDDALQSIEHLAADPLFEVLEITRINNPEVRQQGPRGRGHGPHRPRLRRPASAC